MSNTGRGHELASPLTCYAPKLFPSLFLYVLRTVFICHSQSSCTDSGTGKHPNLSGWTSYTHTFSIPCNFFSLLLVSVTVTLLHPSVPIPGTPQTHQPQDLLLNTAAVTNIEAWFWEGGQRAPTPLCVQQAGGTGHRELLLLHGAIWGITQRVAVHAHSHSVPCNVQVPGWLYACIRLPAFLHINASFPREHSARKAHFN